MIAQTVTEHRGWTFTCIYLQWDLQVHRHLSRLIEVLFIVKDIQTYGLTLGLPEMPIVICVMVPAPDYSAGQKAERSMKILNFFCGGGEWFLQMSTGNTSHFGSSPQMPTTLHQRSRGAENI